MCIFSTSDHYTYVPFIGTEFTLEKLVEIGLDQYAELVGDISSAASKELAIEQVHTHTHTHTLYLMTTLFYRED